MSNDIIQDIWDKKPEEQTMTQADIQAILAPRIRKNAFSLTMWVWVYLMVTAGTLVLHGINIHGYRTNPTMLVVQIAATVLSLGFIGYGIHLVGELGRMERADESVLATLRRRLRFHRSKFEIWIWIITATAYLLQFAINTMVDNQAGVYRINKPGVFIGVSIVMILLLYGVMKIAQYPVVQELRAMASDLEHEVTENTQRVDVLKRTWRVWGILIAIVCLALLVWGVFVAISFMP